MVTFSIKDITSLSFIDYVIELGSSSIPFITPRDVDVLFITSDDICMKLRRWGIYHNIHFRPVAEWRSEGWGSDFSIPPCWWKFYKGNLQDLNLQMTFPEHRDVLSEKNVYREYLWLCYWKHGYTNYLTEEEKQLVIKLHDNLDYAEQCKYEMEEKFQEAVKLCIKT